MLLSRFAGMISFSRLFGKGGIRPALAKLVPDSALMIDPEPFLFRFIGPDNPAMQGLIEMARSNSPLTNPVQERPVRDVKLTSQFGWPPFIRQKPLTMPNPGLPPRPGVESQRALRARS